MKPAPIIIILLLLFLTGCLTKEEKVKVLIQEWNSKNLDEARYESVKYRDFILLDRKDGTPAYRITHQFNYGNKGRLREYYYFIDTTLTKVIDRKRTDWDKEKSPSEAKETID